MTPQWGRDAALGSIAHIRLDDWEMRPDVQTEVAEKWTEIQATMSLNGIDVDAFVTDFERLFGFAIAGIDYDAEVELQPHA